MKNRASETTNVLMVARGLVSEGWCKYHDARDKHRHPTSLFGEHVTAVSMDGAIRLALTGMTLKNRPRTEKTILRKIKALVADKVQFWVSEDSNDYDYIEAFNDTVAKKRQDVLDVFDEILTEAGAIKTAPARQSVAQRYGKR